MSAPCFQDTCSIKWSTVTDPMLGPQYLANVDTDVDSATPTIQCGVDGLEAIISPNGLNTLTSLGDGLYAGLPPATIVSFADEPNTMVQDDVNSDVSFTLTPDPDPYPWINSTFRPAIVLVTGQFNLRYAILGPDNTVVDSANLIRLGGVPFPAVTADPGRVVVPFNAHWQTQVRYGIDDVLTPFTGVLQNVPTSGMISTFAGDNDHQFQTERRQFVFPVRVEVGETLYIRGAAAHEGPNQTINVIARGSGSLANLGISLKNLRLAIFPAS